ncbi:hypothetical protein LTR37_011289 [Vermiconidia calcicola]|uniref:Uncharacterized protein n=1 Tax=Vermiconidia calcicola TaxID=1690605 RepID=A0ACC3N2D6_9PEZI|nr:hypothetical protein LTR37_011289 [Vermiconidia calcicola]
MEVISLITLCSRLVQIICGLTSLGLAIGISALRRWDGIGQPPVPPNGYLVAPSWFCCGIIAISGAGGLFAMQRPKDLHWNVTLTFDFLALAASFAAAVCMIMEVDEYWLFRTELWAACITLELICTIPIFICIYTTLRVHWKGTKPVPEAAKEEQSRLSDIAKEEQSRQWYAAQGKLELGHAPISASSRAPTEYEREYSAPPSRPLSHAETTAHRSTLSGAGTGAFTLPAPSILSNETLSAPSYTSPIPGSTLVFNSIDYVGALRIVEQGIAQGSIRFAAS